MTQNVLDLTICSASFYSRSCLELNWTLTTHLNTTRGFCWLVVENTDGAESGVRVSRDEGRFSVLEGVNCAKTDGSRGSYQHAASLNKALEFISTRFALFLDPDFFIVRPDWIRDVLDHMVMNRLSFFGAPYHPARHTKYRYFPHVACLMVDLERVGKSDLDFTPEIDEMRALQSLTAKMWIAWMLTGRTPPVIEPYANVTRLRALQLLPGNSARQLLMGRILWPFVGISADGGYRIYRRFARNIAHASECVIPVWKRPPRARPFSVKTALVRLVQELDSLLTVPKRRGYYADLGFREYGVPDIARLGWEEYMWRGEPFGFHVQGLFHGRKPVDYPMLADIVNRFAIPA